jgi:zinc transport system substrate-binding protein
MRTVLISTVALVVLAGACGSSAAPSGTGPRLTVVASFYPLAEVAEKVGGTDVSVANLTPPGAEPHDLEPTTRQVDAIQGADLVVDMGRRFQPGVEAATRHRRRGTTLSVLDALRVPGGDVAENAPSGATDPHVWLDPVQMTEIVDVVTTALRAASTSDAIDQRLARRAADYKAQLATLATAYETGLQHCRSSTIVTSHAAFGWLARRYHLEQQAITGLSPEQEPDPRRLSTLADLVKTKHLTTVFTESLVSPKVAETLAREAGVHTAVLDPIEGISRARIAAGADYRSVMTANLAVLRAALGCS